MKTKSLLRFTKPFVTFTMVFLWTVFSVNAQCPSVSDPNPPPICDVAGLNYQNLTSLLITDGIIIDNGASVVYYDALNGGNQIDNDALIKEGIIYVDDDNSGVDCSPRQELNISFTISATNSEFEEFYCSDENPTVQTFIDDALQTFISSGGSVIVYNDFGTNDIAAPTQAITSNTAFEIIFEDAGGCKSQLEDGLAIYIEKPDAPLVPPTQSFCNPGGAIFTIADLDIGTATNVEWYNSSDASGSKLPLTTVINNGDILFVLVSTFPFPCDSETTEVEIIIDEPFDPGTPGNDEFCDDSIPASNIDLFTYLGGAPDTNGTWSGPTTITANPQGTTNISALVAGIHTYIYTVPANGTCPEATSSVTITIYETLSSGTPSAANPASFCEAGLPTSFDLFSLLDNEDIGGQWTQGTTSADPVVNSPIDLTGFTPATYNFTYTQNLSPNPCPEESRTVQVTVLQDPNAGNALNEIFCENDLVSNSPYNLFDALDGSQDNNSGTWTDSSNTTISNSLDITSLTVAGSPYTFNYTIDNGTCSDIEAITITVEPAPESGTPVATFPEFCEGEGSASFDLFTLLEGEDQTGTWNDDDASGVLSGNLVDLSGLTPATYNFTFDVDLIGSCDDVLVTVSVTINPLPNTGTPMSATYCENDLTANSPLGLFGQLTGEDSGGTWTDDNTSGALTGSDVDLTVLTIGSYNFTYTITDSNSCTNSSTVTIIVVDAPESGTLVATFPEFCEGEGSASFDLFTLLEGEDQTGTWNDDDASGVLSGNLVDLSGLTPATYNFTFDVDLIGSCDDVLVTVSVTINPLPNTGTPMSATYCENDLTANSPLGLFGQLTGEDSGGTWTDDNTSGALTGSDVDLTVLTIGSYNFTYTITDSNSCTSSSTVTIIVVDAPESGTPVATFPEFCEGEGSASFDLFTLLEGEDQTGTWNDDDASGALSGNLVDLSGLTPATYNFTFDVDLIGSCDDILVTVSVTINPLPNTGTPMSATYCENDLAANSPLDLFGQLTGEDSGGTWTDDNTSGALTGSDVDLTALTIGSYNFTYTITDSNSCTSSSTVTIIVVDAPESGTANTPIEFCVANITAAQTYNLFDLLTDEDQAGTWSDDDASGALSGNLVTVDGLSPATYNFTYDVDAIGTCDDVNVTVSIIINDTPAPTAITPQEFCDTATVADLVATGTTIQWYDAADAGNLLTDTTALVDGQIYYATQSDATTGCESSVRSAVTAIIYQSPDAGGPNTTAIVACNDNNSIDLFTGLDGTQDTGGTWQNDDGVGSLTGSVFDATGVLAGTYNFTYLVTASSPCVDDSETISITIEEPLNAGSTINPALDICSNEGTTDLFTLLGGADTGGVWSPEMTSTTGVFDPLVDVDGTYIYTLTNSCGTFTNQVEVTLTLAPNAGTDNTLTICAGDSSTDLFTLLGTGAQSGGVWSPELISTTGVFDPALDTAGKYTYTVTALAPCSPDSTAEISVTINDSPTVIVLDPDPEFCLVNNPTVADLSISIRPTGVVNWYSDIALTIPLLSTNDLIDGEDYYATQTNSTGCESSTPVQINVTINDTPTPKLDDPTIEYCINDNPTINTLSLNIVEYDSSLDNLRWYDTVTGSSAISNSSLLTNITYYVVLVNQLTGCESSVRLEVTPDLTACGEQTIPDGFSPNGDGVNDTFDVTNIGIIYPNFEIEIYNRNGNIVYKGNANSTRFDGTSNQSRIVSKGDLPVGVYFYIFNFNDGENKPKQGSLYLSR